MMPLAKTFREAHWEITVGDPTVLGWFTAGAYLVAAIVCLVCWRRRSKLFQPDIARRLGAYWLLLGLAMLLMAVNKQLDLQGLVHATGRNLSIRQGWFDRRHDVMRAAMIGVAIVGALSVAGLLLLMRGLWSHLWLSVVGLALLAGFAVMRTGELLNINPLTQVQHLGPVHLSHALELAGIALVVIDAALRNISTKTATKPVSQSPT